MVETLSDRLLNHTASFLELKDTLYWLQPRGSTSPETGLAKKFSITTNYHTSFLYMPQRKILQKKFRLGFLIVKCLSEESSYGLSQSSIVK